MADRHRGMAEAILEASMAVLPDVPNLVKPGTEFHQAAQAMGAPYVLELYADRAYHSDLTLVSRRVPGAVIKDPEEAAERVARMVLEGVLVSIEGEEVPVQGDSVCVHGDTPGALDIVKAVRRRLEAEGVEVAPLGSWWRR